MSERLARVARVAAHAKLNLSLRILAREQDGYHAIETLFARLALADDVTVHVGTSGRELRCQHANVGPPELNLAFRAAEAFREATGWPRGFAIEIMKRIPAGGGLGGGSADAGAVLRALAALSPVPVPDHTLLRLAMRLGSDVPFLATTLPMALAWGRGERMLALPALASRQVQLAFPPFGVDTADAYGWLAASRERYLPEPMLLTLAEVQSWNALAAVATNDFEAVVCERHPALSRIIASFREGGADIATISGSGSTVFGVLPERIGALDAGEVAGVPMRMTRTVTEVGEVEVGG